MRAAHPAPLEAADLFGPAAASMTCKLDFTGTLVQHAEVRTKSLDGGHFVPVVCVDLEGVGAGHHRIHVEQPFTEATRHEAEALARRLRKGATVTVTTGLTDIRMFLPAAAITTH